MVNEFILDGKTAFISGGGKGVGAGVVNVLARRGVNVGINYYSSEKLALSLYKSVKDEGGNAVLLKGDVSKREQVDKMFSELAQVYGGIDILVNNAGMQKNQWIPEYSEEDYDYLMNVNIKGYFLCTQAVIPYMKKAGSGRILNISSVHAERPTDFDPVYSMTKGANKMLTRESALELGKYGITVNAVDLGAIAIEGKSGNPQDIRSKPGFVPYKDPRRRRVAAAEEAGILAANIISTGDFLNGASVRFDGGRSLV